MFWTCEQKVGIKLCLMLGLFAKSLELGKWVGKLRPWMKQCVKDMLDNEVTENMASNSLNGKAKYTKVKQNRSR